MRMKITAVASVAALFAGAAVAQTPEAAPAAAVQTEVQAVATGSFTDAELKSFDSAMVRMRAVTEALNGGTPSAEQQAEMAAAVQDSGLTIDRFNSIATAVSGDAVLRARLAVASTPPSAAGSVGAGVSDEEVSQFSAAMARMRTVTEALQGGTPSAEQQAEMAAAVQDSGLTIDRFNAVATAVSQDAALRARVELADARRAG